MHNNIYLDNNSTTKVDSEVLESMIPYLENNYGNPSNTYELGRKALKELEKSRKIIADYFGGKKNEVIFTSGATESNVTAIMSAIKSNPNKKHLITTQVEHSSIIETMKDLESEGYEVTYLSVDDKGRFNLNELKSSLTDDTLLVSTIYANNETGTIFPIAEISKIVKENNILFHVDAVQAVGKIDINVKDLKIDMLSLSGHKIHAPKGIGVLYVNEDIDFKPLIHGHQELKRRGGTENVPYIVGLGKAFEILSTDSSNDRIENLRDKLEQELLNKFPDLIIYGDMENRTINTTSIAFPDVNGEKLMMLLEQSSVYVSTGSACNSAFAEKSHVLKAMNAELDNSSPVRISLSKYTTEEEINDAVKKIAQAVNTLNKIK